ncbi:hypothetical protein GR160_07900 [Flavobacterium sp. Sd200]|uniref:hypothetical protein n=1 Tax=Flavobacterium sp. Sd200 TaxID=2692211 RepID=UPI00136E38CC|nr:hypothetical protein [Flavobacterium sp. Sd200]MXN91152.1 hypothetical protein [Flavobacterium sp. Sd200]
MDATQHFSEALANEYPLVWLDTLITYTLNPSRAEHTGLTNERALYLYEQIDLEEAKLQLLIKSRVFALNKKNEIELLIRRFHSSLVILLDHSLENKKRSGFKNPLISKIHKALSACLERLLAFIETRFSIYLGLEERVPATYLMMAKKEFQKRLDKIKVLAQKQTSSIPVFEILLQNLNAFIAAHPLQEEATFRSVLYRKEWLKQLEGLNWDAASDVFQVKLHELLVYMNFNSKAYIKYLTGIIEEEITAKETPVEKMDLLLFRYKAFNQLQSKPGMVLNPKYHDLKLVVGNWFVQEIRYMEKKLQWSALPLPESAKALKPVKTQHKVIDKVLLELSSDQIGLIFRAADDLRILVAKSLSQVFRSITPHLSTPYNDTLSYKGMRTQSYVAEDRDKQIAIDALERIIKKIKEY